MHYLQIKVQTMYDIQRLLNNLESMRLITLNGIKYVEIVKNCHITVKNRAKYMKTVVLNM